MVHERVEEAQRNLLGILRELQGVYRVKEPEATFRSSDKLLFQKDAGKMGVETVVNDALQRGEHTYNVSIFRNYAYPFSRNIGSLTVETKYVTDKLMLVQLTYQDSGSTQKNLTIRMRIGDQTDYDVKRPGEEYFTYFCPKGMALESLRDAILVGNQLRPKFKLSEEQVVLSL